MNTCETCGTEIHDDDDTPVTPEWFAGQGGRMDAHGRYAIPTYSGLAICFSVGSLQLAYGGDIWAVTPGPATRGAVRRLMRALGIEPKGERP